MPDNLCRKEAALHQGNVSTGPDALLTVSDAEPQGTSSGEPLFAADSRTSITTWPLSSAPDSSAQAFEPALPCNSGDPDYVTPPVAGTDTSGNATASPHELASRFAPIAGAGCGDADGGSRRSSFSASAEHARPTASRAGSIALPTVPPPRDAEPSESVPTAGAVTGAGALGLPVAAAPAAASCAAAEGVSASASESSADALGPAASVTGPAVAATAGAPAAVPPPQPSDGSDSSQCFWSAEALRGLCRSRDPRRKAVAAAAAPTTAQPDVPPVPAAVAAAAAAKRSHMGPQPSNAVGLAHVAAAVSPSALPPPPPVPPPRQERPMPPRRPATRAELPPLPPLPRLHREPRSTTSSLLSRLRPSRPSAPKPSAPGSRQRATGGGLAGLGQNAWVFGSFLTEDGANVDLAAAVARDGSVGRRLRGAAAAAPEHAVAAAAAPSPAAAQRRGTAASAGQLLPSVPPLQSKRFDFKVKKRRQQGRRLVPLCGSARPRSCGVPGGVRAGGAAGEGMEYEDQDCEAMDCSDCSGAASGTDDPAGGPTAGRKRGPSGFAPPASFSEPATTDTDADAPCTLEEALEEWRARRARSLRKTPAGLLRCGLLAELAARCPTSILALLDVPGLQRPWVRQFGQEVLDVCRNHTHLREAAAEAAAAARRARRAAVAEAAAAAAAAANPAEEAGESGEEGDAEPHERRESKRARRGSWEEQQAPGQAQGPADGSLPDLGPATRPSGSKPRSASTAAGAAGGTAAVSAAPRTGAALPACANAPAPLSSPAAAAAAATTAAAAKSRSPPAFAAATAAANAAARTAPDAAGSSRQDEDEDEPLVIPRASGTGAKGGAARRRQAAKRAASGVGAGRTAAAGARPSIAEMARAAVEAMRPAPRAAAEAPSPTVTPTASPTPGAKRGRKPGSVQTRKLASIAAVAAAAAAAVRAGGWVPPPAGCRVRSGRQLALAQTPAVGFIRVNDLLGLLAEVGRAAAPFFAADGGERAAVDGAAAPHRSPGGGDTARPGSSVQAAVDEPAPAAAAATAVAAELPSAAVAAAEAVQALGRSAGQEHMRRLRAMAEAALPAWEVRRVLACRSLAAAEQAAAVLRLPSGASRDEVRLAFRRLSLLVHPDKNRSAGAAEAFALISGAARLLGSL